MARLVLAAPVVVLATLVFGLASVAAGLFDRSGARPRLIAGAWGRFLLRVLGVELTVEGEENIPAGPAVYAANHGSSLDIPILFGHLPVDFRIIHKRSLYLIPVVGLYLWVGGHIGIDRGNPFKARRSLESAAGRIAAGTSVVVFPEGTRSRDGSVQRFKKGSLVLAVQARVPVVPVSLAGVKQLAPRGVLRMRPGRVRLTIHPPRPTAGIAVEDARALAEEVRSIVTAAVGPA